MFTKNRASGERKLIRKKAGKIHISALADCTISIYASVEYQTEVSYWYKYTNSGLDKSEFKVQMRKSHVRNHPYHY